MITFHNTGNNHVIAELTDSKFIINEVQDAVDLLGDLGMHNCNSMIIREQSLSADFFDLKTRLAGEILQKFSNYRVRLAIVGDFAKYKSKSLQDFIRESNRGSHIYFADTLDSALSVLSRTR